MSRRSVIRDIDAFTGMLEARHSGQYQFVHDRGVVKCKRSRKDPIADDPMRLSCMGERDMPQSAAISANVGRIGPRSGPDVAAGPPVAGRRLPFGRV